MSKQTEQPLKQITLKGPEIILLLKESLGVLNGKWKLPVIVALMNGPLRFMEIQRMLQDISPKVLSKELKNLETGGFILRTVYCTTPVVVEYKLLPNCITLQPIINELIKWAIDRKRDCNIAYAARDEHFNQATALQQMLRTGS